MSEQVPNDTGVIVNPNVSEIVSAIEFFYDNPEKIKEFSANALDYSLKELSWCKSADTLLKFIKTNQL
ncbi:hypothetical protein D3C87_2156390 [compost metagenome]